MLEFSKWKLKNGDGVWKGGMRPKNVKSKNEGKWSEAESKRVCQEWGENGELLTKLEMESC